MQISKWLKSRYFLVPLHFISGLIFDKIKKSQYNRSKTTAMMTIYLVRHGETEENLQRILPR